MSGSHEKLPKLFWIQTNTGCYRRCTLFIRTKVRAKSQCGSD